jgi:hypothetical protein
MIKKIVLFILLSVIFIVFGGSIGNFTSERVKAEKIKETDVDSQILKRISEMSDEELRSFLSEYTRGYRYRDDSDKDLMLYLLKTLISQFDSPGKTYVPFNYSKYSAFAEEIDEAVNLYYGEDFEDTYLETRYDPQQNSFVEIPSNMNSFKCYGYVIGLYSVLDPGFSENRVLDLPNETAYSLATYVRTDLKSSYLNQNCVKLTTVCPDYSSLAGRSAICVRKGSDIFGYYYDYHLMKLTSTGWLHKPGNSAIIKHLLPHSTATNWLAEYTYDGVNWDKINYFSYSGQIYYILYQPNHTYQLGYTGNSYHSGHYHYYQKAYICTNCGTSYGAYYEKVPCNGPPCLERSY